MEELGTGRPSTYATTIDILKKRNYANLVEKKFNIKNPMNFYRNTIVGKIKGIIDNNMDKIKKVYLTGTASLINNIDLYFQEYLGNVDCEILRPYFIETTRDISIKDYIEVNSAISLAMMGVGEGLLGMNFKNQTFGDKIPDWLKLEVNPDKKPGSKDKKLQTGMFTWDLGEPLDKTELGLVRIIVALILLVVIYTAFSLLLSTQMASKTAQVDETIAFTQTQINSANSDDRTIRDKTSQYTALIQSLEKMNSSEGNTMKNSIPNLLNQIMSIVPENVQITSIENTSDRHVVITAQSDKYEQLGFLTAKIKAEEILRNTISTSGQKDNNVVTIKIEGELP